MPCIELTTDRFLLRPLMDSDAPSLGIAMRDANVTENISFEPPAQSMEEGIQRARDRIEGLREHWNRYGFGILGAVAIKTGKLIGYSGFRHLAEFDGDIHISTMVDRPYWSGGPGAKIIRRYMEYIFLERGFEAIYGTARLSEVSGLHLLDALGFIREDDRMLRNWPVGYFKLTEAAFLKNHIEFLKRQIVDPPRADAPRTVTPTTVAALAK